MATTSLDIPTPAGTADAIAAYPTEHGRYPGVLLYMDAIGLRPVIREMAATLASHGYYVLAPNLMYRHGRAPLFDLPDRDDPASFGAFFEKAMPVMESHTPDEAATDARAYLDFLGQHDRVRPGKVAMTGYCMGGTLAFRAAATHPERIAAAASFHGGHLATTESDSPHLYASDITAEMYFAHAHNDASMPAGDITRLEESLDTAGVTYTSEVYPASHGFTMADTPSYSPPALQRHWESLLALLERTLPAQ